MDERLKQIVGEIKKKYPEFYEKNKSIITIIDKSPGLTVLSKDIFKRVMQFIEELDQLEIAQLSKEEQYKIRRVKEMYPSTNKLWGLTKIFQKAQDQINKEKEEKP